MNNNIRAVLMRSQTPFWIKAYWKLPSELQKAFSPSVSDLGPMADNKYDANMRHLIENLAPLERLCYNLENEEVV
jgi:hypothetical protein